jgi:hypothetical protein
VLRRIFGTKTDEVKGGWRKLHNKELHNLYSLPSIHIFRMIKSMRIRWNDMQKEWRERRMHVRYIFGGKARGKEIIRKTKTYVGG